MKTVRLLIPNEQEKLFTFEHSQDGKSVTITDEQNLKIQIFRDEKNRIVRMVLPEGGEALVEWQDTGNGGMIPSNIILKQNGAELASLRAAGNACMDALERAGAATVVASEFARTIPQACLAGRQQLQQVI